VRKTIKLLFFVVLWSVTFPVSKSHAISFVRDAEIERTIALFAKPIFEAAGLSADNIEIYLVNDSRLNAFVANGQKLFIHTGLLQRSKSPEQVIGVIAHETGHIAGGHLSRIRQKMEETSPESILGFILGGAAILAGQPGAGSAIIMGGQDMATRSLLKYSRTEEASADQAAVTYLDETKTSTRGLLEFFEILKKTELSSTSQQNPYIRTHPLTAERITFLAAHVAKSPLSDIRVSDEFIELHARMRAKLDSYLLSPTHTFRLYPTSDTSIPARYARAQAYHKDNQHEKAIAEIDGLIADHPNDPYFYELKGQIYFENGDIENAIEAYKKSVAILPKHPLLLLALGRAYQESGKDEYLPEAIDLLEQSIKQDNTSSFTWRQLGIAYGRANRMAESSLALAEEAYLQRHYKEAIFLAGRAEKEFKTGSPQWIQAQDLRLASERLQKKQNK